MRASPDLPERAGDGDRRRGVTLVVVAVVCAWPCTVLLGLPLLLGAAAPLCVGAGLMLRRRARPGAAHCRTCLATLTVATTDGRCDRCRRHELEIVPGEVEAGIAALERLLGQVAEARRRGERPA